MTNPDINTQNIVRTIHETFAHKSQTSSIPLGQSQELWDYNMRILHYFNDVKDIHQFILKYGLKNGKITLPYLCRNLQDMHDHQLDYILDFINTCYYTDRITKQITNKFILYFSKRCHRNSRDLECLYQHEQLYFTSCNLKKIEYSQTKKLHSQEEIQDYLWLTFVGKVSQILRFTQIYCLNDHLSCSELWFTLTVLRSDHNQLSLSYSKHKKHSKEIEREFKLLLIQEIIHQTTPIS